MPQGVPITPDQARTIVETWRATGSKSEAARAAGLDESTARRCIAREREPEYAELHARAVARAERAARKRVGCTGADLRARLVTLLADPESAPSDIAVLARAATDADRLLVVMGTEIAKRMKLAAETAAINRAVTNDGTAGELLVVELPSEEKGEP